MFMLGGVFAVTVVVMRRVFADEQRKHRRQQHEHQRLHETDEQFLARVKRMALTMAGFQAESVRWEAEGFFPAGQGAEVYALAKGFPDAALEKGGEAFKAARAIGNRTLEFAAAGGVALVQAELGNAAEADRWIARAAAVAADNPVRNGVAAQMHGTAAADKLTRLLGGLFHGWRNTHQRLMTRPMTTHITLNSVSVPSIDHVQPWKGQRNCFVAPVEPDGRSCVPRCRQKLL